MFVMVICGLFLSFGLLCGFTGTSMLPLSTFAIILNLKPIIVILVSFCFINEKLTLIKFVLIIISFTGATLIVNPNLVYYVLSFFFKGFYNPDESMQHEYGNMYPKLTLRS